MRIGVLGAGNVGAALAGAWLDAGHAVVLGVRDPFDARHAAHRRDGVAVADVSAAADADVVVLATPWPATLPLVRSVDLSGRTVIDATNPVSVTRAGVERLPTSAGSGAQDVAAASPGAFVFKTLNQVGADVMRAPRRAAAPPLMFVAGDDAARKRVVLGLVSEIGFDARDAGRLTVAADLEGLAALWIGQAFGGPLGRNFAFAAVPWKPSEAGT